MDETYEDEIDEMEEDSEQTLNEIVQDARKSYKAKKAASQNKDENVETAEEKEPSPKKYGKGRDISKVASVMKAQRADKIALRPRSRSKYFEFDSLETKGWDLKKFTNPQGWTNFVSLQEHTYEELVREFYPNLAVKQKKKENENFLISSIKGVQITVTQDFLSEVLKIPNEGNKLFSCSWFDDLNVDRNQLITKYTKEKLTFNSTNLVDVPKILHNMIRHTLVPKCGSFDVVYDMDLCIIHHLLNKTKLNLCFLIIQHMIDSCSAIKQTVAGLPYGMHFTPIFQKAKVPLEGEKRKLDFMKFTSKTLGELRITTTNMASFTTFGNMGLVRDLLIRMFQKIKKKRKIEEIKDKTPENTKVRPSFPLALEIFSKVAELAKEIVEEGNTQFSSLIGK